MSTLLVIPCFNEERRWHREYWIDLAGLPDVHWLFVNDGSSDRTAAILEELRHLANVDVLNLHRNTGKGEATRAGMLRGLNVGLSEFAHVGFMDADGAFSRGDVEATCKKSKELSMVADIDAVWSSRVALAGRDIQRSPARHYVGRVVATLLSVGADPLPYDTQAGLKIFRVSSDLRACLTNPFETRWLFEVELLARWKKMTGRSMRIWEEPLEFWKDVGGSKITGRESARIVRELWHVKRLQFRDRSTTAPERS